MYITLETDYAVRIVSALCVTGRRMEAKEISRYCCVPQRFALKILRKLVNAEIIISYKGMQGGYKLACSADDITLAMVVEAIEGTYYFSRCLSPDGECSRGMSGICCYQKAFEEITAVVREKLEGYTFSTLLKNSSEYSRIAGEQENAVLEKEKV